MQVSLESPAQQALLSLLDDAPMKPIHYWLWLLSCRGLVRREGGQALRERGNGFWKDLQIAASQKQFIGVVLFQEGKPLKLGVGLGQGENRWVPGRNCLDFGVGEFLTADVFGSLGSVSTRHYLGDKAGFGFQSLPHVGVK